MAAPNTTAILNLRRPMIWGQFQKLNYEPLPDADLSPEEAWKQGLKAGFGQGLVFGVNLGLEVVSSMGEFEFADIV